MRGLAFGALLLMACEGVEEDLFCEDVPVLTWDNFGADFMLHSCQTCHASSTLDRHGAPESVSFDTYERVIEQRGRILDQVTGEEPFMPPSGGISEDEQWKVEVWLRCFED